MDEIEDDWFEMSLDDFRIPKNQTEPTEEPFIAPTHCTQSRTSTHIQDHKQVDFTAWNNLSPLSCFLQTVIHQDRLADVLHESRSLQCEMARLLPVIATCCEVPLLENKMRTITSLSENGLFWESVLRHFEILKYNNTPDGLSETSIALKSIGIICRHCVRSHTIPPNMANILKYLADCENDLSNAHNDLKSLCIELEATENETPPTISDIYPSLEDIHGKITQKIYSNQIVGPINSISDYKQMHSSLLREDFLIPLRESLSAFLSGNVANNVAVSKNVKLQIDRNTKIIVDLDFMARKQPATHTNVLTPRNNLMIGSLICLSTQLNFENLILAVVVHTPTTLLEQNYIYVELLKIDGIDGQLFGRKLVMIESKIFFEPYHYVYRTLQNLDKHNFPLKKYIIDVDTNSELPGYIPSQKEVIYNHNNLSFNVKSLKWPSASDFNYDDDQLAAFRSALTQKLCLIHGPSGTGKTFIGLEILRALLSNTSAQILVICYSNAALDQFLEGALAYTKNIVRMGGQSKSVLLENYKAKHVQKELSGAVKKCLEIREQDIFYALRCLQELMSSHDKTGQLPKQLEVAQNRLYLAYKQRDEILQIHDYDTIKNRKLIGMTTSYAAKHMPLLQMLSVPIVIVEEAAEILESHVIASLTENTQQLIMIGDHKQLRPINSVYKLWKKYKMNVSLFERMITNQVNVTTMNTQYRMRPELSSLLIPFYKNLMDHSSVKDIPLVQGVEKSLFCVHHTHAEEESKSSKRNIFEAHELLQFCSYLNKSRRASIKNTKAINYITIIAAYAQQAEHILLEKKNYEYCEDVTVHTIDSFQGQESEVILLSLVRSNTRGDLGYLKIENRICVALSRARSGLFIIGNIDLMANGSHIWTQIRAILKEREAIGSSFPVVGFSRA